MILNYVWPRTSGKSDVLIQVGLKLLCDLYVMQAHHCAKLIMFALLRCRGCAVGSYIKWVSTNSGDILYVNFPCCPVVLGNLTDARYTCTFNLWSNEHKAPIVMLLSSLCATELDYLQ